DGCGLHDLSAIEECRTAVEHHQAVSLRGDDAGGQRDVSARFGTEALSDRECLGDARNISSGDELALRLRSTHCVQPRRGVKLPDTYGRVRILDRCRLEMVAAGQPLPEILAEHGWAARAHRHRLWLEARLHLIDRIGGD